MCVDPVRSKVRVFVLLQYVCVGSLGSAVCCRKTVLCWSSVIYVCQCSVESTVCVCVLVQFRCIRVLYVSALCWCIWVYVMVHWEVQWGMQCVCSYSACVLVKCV